MFTTLRHFCHHNWHSILMEAGGAHEQESNNTAEIRSVICVRCSWQDRPLWRNLSLPIVLTLCLYQFSHHFSLQLAFLSIFKWCHHATNQAKSSVAEKISSDYLISNLLWHLIFSACRSFGICKLNGRVERALQRLLKKKRKCENKSLAVS